VTALRSSAGRWRLCAITLLCAALCSFSLAAPPAAPPGATPTSAAQLQRIIESITSGEGSAQRAAAIERQLEALGIPFRRQEFTARGRRGVNLIAELPGTGTKKLLLGAHYDRVAVGRGAVDNASGCAAVLDLLAHLKAEPLRGYSVSAAFFDLEEAGLLGSKAYVEEAGTQVLPALYINFDVFGYGDTLWAMSPLDDSPPAKAFQQAGRETKFPLRVTRDYPPSDHLSFSHAGVESLSLSLLPAGEIDGILASLTGAHAPAPPAETPRVMKIIHSAEDTLEKIDSAAMARALPTVLAAVRGLESSAKR
jgi:aminopeptidase S